MSRVSGVAELVRVMILRGEIGLGELIVEPHLVARFKVGHGTLREALRRLEGEGILVSSHSGAMRVVDIDRDAVLEAVQARAALEALSAALAARSVRDGATETVAMRRLSTLAGLADSVARSGTAVAAVIADRNFHRAVDSLGANRPAQRALDAIWDRLVLAEVHGIWSAPRVTAHHGPLLAAIEAGNDDEAAELARGHVAAAHLSGGRLGRDAACARLAR